MGTIQSIQEVLGEYREIADSYRGNPDQIFSDQPLLWKITEELLYDVESRVTPDTRKSYDRLVTFFLESCDYGE